MKPAANREAVHHIQAAHGYPERRACRVIQFNRCSARLPPSEGRDLLLRTRMPELANDRRRFGSPRLHELLRREDLVQNHKRTERIYQEENLSLRTRKRVKRPSHALEVDMSLPGVRVMRVLERLRLQGRLPQRIKVDNGPEFRGKALDIWIFSMEYR